MRAPLPAYVKACLMSATGADGMIDHSKAAVPVTKGAAAEVPLKRRVPPPAARLCTSSPGADKPRRPIDGPKFDKLAIRPPLPQAATGSTAG